MLSRVRFIHQTGFIGSLFRNQLSSFRLPSTCQACAFHQTKFLRDQTDQKSQKSELKDTTTVKKPTLSPLASSDHGPPFNLRKILGRKRALPQPEKEWELIYKCYLLMPSRTIQKLKIYQTAFTCVMAPIAAFSSFAGLMDSFSAGCVVFASGIASVMLYIMGTLCSRLIGHMYLSTEHQDKVKIATLTFWGGRLDTVYDISDLAPFSTLTVNPKDIYITLPVTGDEKLYLSLRYGIFRTLDDIEYIFGPIPSEWKVKLRTMDEAKENANKSDDLESSNKNSSKG